MMKSEYSDSPGEILVALSGGIDSAASVFLLQEKGFRVTGLYIDMLDNEAARNKAVAVAQKLGIELHIENVVDEFRKKIINYTLSEHQAGRTPSPCVRCNPLIKWEVAVRVADRLGITFLATGHYVRIIDGCVYKGVDPTKDQSYYLWGVPEHILRRAVTPLGDYTKQQVREYLAQKSGFGDMASGGESMSICFIGREPYNKFLADNLSIYPGEVVDLNGGVVGNHCGFQLYTIGQKRNFTGGGAVISVDASRNQLIVSADDRDLFTGTMILTDFVLRDVDPSKERIDIKVRGIGRNPESGVKSIEMLSDDMLKITLNAADAWALAKGQPVVFYSGDRVVGGGIVSLLFEVKK